MLAPSKGYPEPSYENDRAIRFPESHGSYAFWLLCVPVGLMIAAAIIVPVLTEMSADAAYLYAFFERLR